MKSSYATNNYGELFEAIVRVKQPSLIVEFGILEGYSTTWFLKGLRTNGKGRLKSYDLFEEYSYRHARYHEILHRFRTEIEDGILTVERGNYYEMVDRFEDSSIPMIHVDISNDGNTFDFFFAHYLRKLIPGGLAIMEGGGQERDKIEWMIKYNKRPIRPLLDSLDSSIHFIVLEPYPSIALVWNHG